MIGQLGGAGLLSSVVSRQGDVLMNGWGLFLWLASIAAVYSVPLILFAGLMRLVGRMGSRVLVGVLAADAVLWALAAVFWWGRLGG